MTPLFLTSAGVDRCRDDTETVSFRKIVDIPAESFGDREKRNKLQNKNQSCVVEEGNMKERNKWVVGVNTSPDLFSQASLVRHQ